ncbi:unnamed protein product [Orchesella dallaii]|uniref:Uncharacterized protein n=1 Tax=Orchesella dallaii TaxID=48710 RepID=A0ABP1S8Y3_9HEXA
MDIKTIVTLLFNQIIFAEIAFSWRSRSHYYIDAQNFISKAKKSSWNAKYLKNHMSAYDEFKVHSLEGLGEFLQAVQHCLIHMTNFGGVDLPSLSVASIQRKTELAVCYDGIYAVSSSLQIRHNTTLAHRQKLSCHKIKPKCPLSPLFADSKCVCAELNFRKFVTRIRPWTCEIIVSIYQKQVTEPESGGFTYIGTNENAPSVFEQISTRFQRHVHYSIPSYSPINIFITEQEDTLASPQTWESHNAIGAWFKFRLNTNIKSNFAEKRISRDTYFAVCTKPLILNNNFTSEDYKVHKIRNVFAMQLKLSFGKFEIHFVNAKLLLNDLGPISTRLKNEPQIKLFDPSVIIDFFFATTLFRTVSLFTPEKFLHESICKNLYLRIASNRPQASGEFYTVNWIGEWLQILRRYNYTILYHYNQISCNTMHIKLHELEENSEFIGYSSFIETIDKIYPTTVSHPLALDNPMRKIGFISCGSSAVRGLPFRELFRVFDGYVWVCLVIINSIVMPIILCIMEWVSDKNQNTSDPPDASQKNLFSSRMFFQPVIILLEQGGAFTNKHLNTAALRWVAAALILVAIVLSNSYKYDNVYNMMLPRETTPLWFFEQLVAEKFSIYTRTNFYTHSMYALKLSYPKNDSGLPSEWSAHASIVIDNNSKPRVLYSELCNILYFDSEYLQGLNLELLYPWQEDGIHNKLSTKETMDYYWNLFPKLLTKTKLLPFENTLPHELTIRQLYKNDYYNYQQKASVGRKEFDIRQSNRYMQILNECQNTAFVLPYANIVNLFAKLRNQGNSKLTIGKEVLLERNIGMALHGWISNHLINTLGWIPDFGYWKHVRNIYWENITSISHVTSDYSHQTSQISGNILIPIPATVSFALAHRIATFVTFQQHREKHPGEDFDTAHKLPGER